MKIDFPFYTDWIAWAFDRVKVIATRSPVELAAFHEDLKTVYLALVEVWKTVPTGSGFKLLTNMLKWVAVNPDPLLPVRNLMRAMKTRWS